jgi:hypothetical protein
MTSPRWTTTPKPPPGEGPFYVVSECCISCGVPEAIAPDLFGWHGNVCHVKRQPETNLELDQMIEAISCSEVDCIRYAGSDPAVLRRLGEAALADQADDPAAAGFAPKLRNRVTFRMTDPDGPLTPTLIADRFGKDQRAEGRTVRRSFLASASVRVAWYRRHFHTVRFTEMPTPGRWLATLESNVMPGLSRLVYGWLKEREASDIRWFASEDDLGGLGQLTPL